MTGGILPIGKDVMTMSVLPALSAKTAANMANIDAAAQDFEAMFATQMLQPMFETVSVNGVFGGGHGEEVMRSFMLQEYGKMIAKKGTLGIAPQVKTEMLRAQETAAKERGDTPVPANAPGAYPNTQAKGAADVSS